MQSFQVDKFDPNFSKPACVRGVRIYPKKRSSMPVQTTDMRHRLSIVLKCTIIYLNVTKPRSTVFVCQSAFTAAREVLGSLDGQ